MVSLGAVNEESQCSWASSINRALVRPSEESSRRVERARIRAYGPERRVGTYALALRGLLVGASSTSASASASWTISPLNRFRAVTQSQSYSALDYDKITFASNLWHWQSILGAMGF